MVGGIKEDKYEKGKTSFSYTIYFYIIFDRDNILKVDKFFNNKVNFEE
jgi:hypothetical protein